MQRVSKVYKESMKSLLRERGFIVISLGLINQEAQTSAKIEKGDFSYYSTSKSLFSESLEDNIYATLEEHFTKLDGSMRFLPRKEEQEEFIELLDTGLISKDFILNGKYEITIKLKTREISVKGLTIDFGDNYPVDFDVLCNTGQKIEIRGNDKAVWKTEDVFEDILSIKLIFYKMKFVNNRVRIYGIRFGYGLVYDNEYIIESNLESYVSPIGADVPQIDFSVQLANDSKYFNVDNPNSAINYLEVGQEMDIMYGYQLPDSDTIEWIKGNHLVCSEWESDDNVATLHCQDVFRNMDSEFAKGFYSSKARSYYDLAQDVLKDAGIKNYYLDPVLKKLFTKNPIPMVKHKEALQIIANACRCVLTQSRSGDIQIKSNFIPDVTVSANNESYFSSVSNVLNDSEKREYATLDPDYSVLDSRMYFLPKAPPLLNTGYVSEVISDSEGFFRNNPVVTLKMEASRSYYSLNIIFGNTLPEKFIIYTYNIGELINTFVVDKDEISKKTNIIRTFGDCDVIKIEFLKTSKPNKRIIVNQIGLDEAADFIMTREDMTSPPKAIKQELVKEVIVPCYTYQKSDKEENLLSEDVESTGGQVETYYFREPSYGYTVKVDEKSDLAEVLEQGDYYVKIKYKTAGKHKLEIKGYNYKIVEKYSKKSLNNIGKTVKWENPLIDNINMANELVEWLSEYYSADIEYEYDTRGNPELDATDIIYQENDFRNNMKISIYRHTIKFEQSFSGKVMARIQGGS